MIAVDSREPGEAELNQFITAQPYSVYLQSWQWGEFQRGLGRSVQRRIWQRDNAIVAAATLIHQPLPITRGYGYVPKGPVVAGGLWHDQELWQSLTQWLREQNAENGFIFTQIEPPREDAAMSTQLSAFGWIKAPATQPVATQVIDLSLSEADLLAAMHSKTRYNIRLAERKGVTISWHGSEQLPAFWRLATETNRRESIRGFPLAYYEKMMAAFGQAAQLVVATYSGKPVAINLIITIGDTVTYAHGASADADRNVMAPHLLQGETIRWAKAHRYRYYDFRGIAPHDDPQHRWAGITRFKKGFGGLSVLHIGAFDLVNRSLWYRLYRLYRHGN